MKKIRPFEEQTPLEKVLRSHLWHPTNALKQSLENLPKHVRRKEYKLAYGCQVKIIRAKHQIKDWEYLLELYEEERRCGDPRALLLLAKEEPDRIEI